MVLKFAEDDESSTDKKWLAKNLAILLKQNKLNANQLGLSLGIPMMTIRRILSGETEDPRISTLKLIAEYFDISIDALINSNPDKLLTESKNITTYVIPKLNWESLPSINFDNKNAFQNFNEWQTLSLNSKDLISKKAFAIESRPSMYPRFPKGTIFVIDPEATPADGDIVLIQILSSNDFTSRELILDVPTWRLSPLIPDSNTINFSKEEHRILGVSLLTMLYSPKLTG